MASEDQEGILPRGGTGAGRGSFMSLRFWDLVSNGGKLRLILDTNDQAAPAVEQDAPDAYSRIHSVALVFLVVE